MKNTLKVLIVLSLAAGCSLPAGARPAPSSAQGQQGAKAPAPQAATQPAPPPPLTLEEVIHLFKKNKKHLERIIPELQQRGVNFEMTPAIAQEFQKAGADSNFISQVQHQGPAERAMAATGVSPEENAALLKINDELDPSRKIQLAEDFVKQFPNSKDLTYAYFLAEGAYLQKQDIEHALEYGAKSLKMDPDNLNALMLTASLLPNPQSLSNDPDPDRKLKQAEVDATKALELIAKLSKFPSETEAQFEERKGGYIKGMHAALGMVHLQRATEGLTGVDADELGKSENEYKLAIAATPNPNPEDYFRLGEVYTFEKKNQDAIQAFTKVVELANNPTLKSYAQQHIDKLKAAK
jgi:tetratricopeptide (TPR) repeat protein